MLIRAWEETHQLGRRLAELDAITGKKLCARLRDLDRHFELGRAPEEEAVHLLLVGLIAVLPDADDDDDD